MTNELYSNIGNAKVTFVSSVYNSNYAGLYTITVSYNWGGAGYINFASRTFTYTLNDPCIVFVKIPTFVDLNGLLHDPDSTLNVSPSIFTSLYDFCGVSISITVIKNGLIDVTGNFIQFNDIPPTSIHDLASAKITFNSSGYNMSLFGVYTINLTYNWIAGPIVRTFNFNLGDACT